MSASLSLVSYRCGPFELYPEMRLLRGPLGEKLITGQLYTLVERLMRRPGAVVPLGSLISALYPNPDDEPEYPEKVVAVVLVHVRKLFRNLSDDGAPIVRVIYGSGWSLSHVEPLRRVIAPAQARAL